ncbi:SRPBCC family protein [Taibaiella lutea]|uniref:SRPBCC family protein n=1 Tax=Taibaiella lutea TaxID=2608001 RepID=A0A5M6CMA3_9BACT|nr:SRPBCC family protein [Taibaiella lutea]KAA5536264.1 SRPBCC family protein [Taibaiella lutea]
MKRFFKLLGIIILLLVIIILVAGFFISPKFHFEKSIVINAPKEEVWKNISTFSNFEKWDPWSIQDPKIQKSISGTDGTPGATYSWIGNDDVGTGSQTFIEIAPFDHINIDLEFKEPFEKKAAVKYILLPDGNKTKITWSFDTEFSYPWNAVSSLFMNLDKRMDKDFSTGLANLKKLCESNVTYITYNCKESVKTLH